jgi:hypothetical protein
LKCLLDRPESTDEGRLSSDKESGRPVSRAGCKKTCPPHKKGYEFVATARDRTGAKAAHYKPRIGICFMHTVIEDYFRSPYAEAHDDERPSPRPVYRTVAWFAVASPSSGAVRHRVCVHLRRVARQLCGLGIKHKRTRPRRPQTNGRRKTPPDHGRRLGLQEALQLRVRPTRRAGRMATPVRPPPAPSALGGLPPISRLDNLAGITPSHAAPCGSPNGVLISNMTAGWLVRAACRDAAGRADPPVGSTVER